MATGAAKMLLTTILTLTNDSIGCPRDGATHPLICNSSKTRSATLEDSTDDGLEIYKTVCRLLPSTPVGETPVRLLGISVSCLKGLEAKGQLSLFPEKASSEKRKQLNKALDAVYRKHGETGLRPGTLVDDGDGRHETN